MPVHAFETPRLRSLARQGLPSILEGVVIPLAVFYAALWIIGMWGALIAALGWSYIAIARRVIRRERIPALVVLSALALTFRTALALATGSVFFYFLQPSLGTALFGFALLVTMRTGQPLIQRLARDFLPFSPEFFANPFVRQFFLRISLLWAAVMLANAGVTIWMLIQIPVSLFVIAKTVASAAFIGAGVVYSLIWFRRLFAPTPVRSAA